LHWWLVNCYKKVEGESFLLKSCLSDPRRYNLAQSIRHRKDKRRKKAIKSAPLLRRLRMQLASSNIYPKS
jgi:hypothetical protein